MSEPEENEAEATGFDPEKGPHRRCIVTGAVQPKEMMIRFVIGPDQTLVPDVAGRLPGRGMWLSADRDVIHSAVAKSVFAKASRQKLAVPPDLAERLEGLLRQRCLDLLGLTRRAGEVVSGFEKVRAALKSGQGAVILAARDAARDGVEKIRALAPKLPVVAVLSAAELGAAFGRDHTVHGVLMPGKLAQSLLSEARRLEGVMGEAAATPQWRTPDGVGPDA